MFLASKFVSIAIQPLTWVIVLLLLSLLYLPLRRKLGLRLGWTALTLVLLLGWEPLPDALLRRLETQHPEPSPQSSLQQYTGVVVLGGAAESADIWQQHHQVALNEAAERMTVPLTLLRQYPHLQLLFSGGDGELFGQGMSEADRARIFFDSMGVAPQRISYESNSRTTYENATFSAALPGINPAQPWLLLTSAWHMPRAIATFRKAGWNVTPYSVDFRTGAHTPWTQYSVVDGARKWRLALHELAGLLAYHLAGRT